VSEDFTLTVSREIAASAEVLFDAWLEPRSLGIWLRPSVVSQTRAELEPWVGGEFRIVMVRDDAELLHSGRYLEIDRPRRLVFSWSSPATGHRESIVTVTFQARADSTLVEIHQVGLADEQARAGHHEGWSDALRELEAFSDERS
jgi:uncharacterized protein YndB with AHSA1/START domain